jgi:hypothetical protein
MTNVIPEPFWLMTEEEQQWRICRDASVRALGPEAKRGELYAAALALFRSGFGSSRVRRLSGDQDIRSTKTPP